MAPDAPLPDDARLPPLREDLRIQATAPFASGAPAWVIYDPARHRYFQIGQRAVEILSAWGEGVVGALKRRLEDERGMSPKTGELRTLLSFLVGNELTTPEGRSGGLAERAERARRAGLLGLAKTYLFFRVPLLRPDRFLTATAHLAAPFFSRGFALFALLAGVVGLLLAARQLDAFLAYTSRFASLEGIGVYAAAIAGVKVFHELGHAYQATLRGVRVPSMGVAFMVLFPLLYTDVSDAWRLKRRRDKLMIDAGGVLVELSLAAFATLLWVFLPDGAARSAAFAVATTSWVLSLMVNLNPFMRFDGYYFLADATGFQNLQPRAFAMCRWRLREFLFDLRVPAPEPVSAGARRFMVWYALGTWIYRLFLFIGIAFLVYEMFFKALGLLLFTVEIAFFVALPILKEVGVWFSLRAAIVRRARSWLTLAVFAGLVALAAIPTPVAVRAPAVLTSAAEAEVFAGGAGRLAEIDMAVGRSVSAGDLLARLESPELESQARASALRIELLEKRLARGAADVDERAARVVLEHELQRERDRLAGIGEELDHLNIRAPISGVIVEAAPGAQPPIWLGRRDRLGRIASPDARILRGYLSEDDLARVGPGATGVFAPDDAARPTIDARLEEVDEFAAAALRPGYLAATNGGPIAVEPGGGEGPPVPTGSWYRISAAIDAASNAPTDRAIRGVIVFQGRNESLLRRIALQIARVLIRETSA